ncbi:hypothetical protein ZWY2020_048236 [Hordeum vulgare]|nr:hypothetical protein ZWY2020_048236 [Hordeum vulgare]
MPREGPAAGEEGFGSPLASGPRLRRSSPRGGPPPWPEDGGGRDTGPCGGRRLLCCCCRRRHVLAQIHGRGSSSDPQRGWPASDAVVVAAKCIREGGWGQEGGGR